MSQPARPPALSPEQRRTLTAVLDRIVPPSRDGRLPGAGGVGGAEAVERSIERTPELGPALAQGLADLDALARRRGASDFAAVPEPERDALLAELGAQRPGFVPSLIFPSYVAYYQSPRVLEALGFEPRPPFPRGYAVADGDPTLLDPVRRRAKLYREC